MRWIWGDEDGMMKMGNWLEQMGGSGSSKMDFGVRNIFGARAIEEGGIVCSRGQHTRYGGMRECTVILDKAVECA